MSIAPVAATTPGRPGRRDPVVLSRVHARGPSPDWLVRMHQMPPQRPCVAWPLTWSFMCLRQIFVVVNVMFTSYQLCSKVVPVVLDVKLTRSVKMGEISVRSRTSGRTVSNPSASQSISRTRWSRWARESQDRDPVIAGDGRASPVRPRTGRAPAAALGPEHETTYPVVTSQASRRLVLAMLDVNSLGA
jgi:hypothetical protein